MLSPRLPLPAPLAPVTAFLLLASLLLLSAGCATRQSVETLQKQMEDLQRRNFQLRKELAEARVRLEIAKEGAGEPDRAGRTRTTAPRAAHSPQVPGVAESSAKDAAPRVIYSEPITDASRYTSGPLSSAAAAGSSASRLMSLARERLDAQDPATAMATFQQIVARHPEDALADDAQFGIGECLFQMGRYEEAIAEYSKVARAFPYGDQVPFASLKIGFSHLAMEKRDLAMDSFVAVSQTYPGTEAATVARQQIAHLKAAGK